MAMITGSEQLVNFATGLQVRVRESTLLQETSFKESLATPGQAIPECCEFRKQLVQIASTRERLYEAEAA